ncbi:hypothetical protein ACTNDG_08745 [Clostridium sp. HCP1S3_B4]
MKKTLNTLLSLFTIAILMVTMFFSSKPSADDTKATATQQIP